LCCRSIVQIGFASSVFYVVDRLLSPPSLVQFLGITAAHSDLKVTNAYNLYSAVFWDTVEMGSLLGYKEGKNFTLFAPTDDISGVLPLEETTRLLNPIWSRHLEDLLKHWLTDRAYTRQQLRQMAVSSGGEFPLLMLSGSTVLIVAEGDDDLSVSDGSTVGSFLKPSDLRGVDG
jgi:Fasciclin domain